MADYRVISSDNHVYEPVELWTGRAAPSLKDRMPHIERLDDGDDWWFCDGHKIIGTADGSQVGMRFEEHDKIRRARPVAELRPGGWVPEEHIKDMAEDGVDVSIVFPTACLSLYSMPDSDLLTEIFRIYDDWLGEFCKPFPDRLKGVACINVDDVKTGVKELERCAKMGLTGGMITVYPPMDRQYSLPEYDLLWAAAQDLQMPLALHIATNRPGIGQDFMNAGDQAHPAFITNVDHWVRMSLSHIIFSGVFQRFPKLQIGSVEMELSWVPHFLDRLDYTYTQRVPREEWWDRYT